MTSIDELLTGAHCWERPLRRGVAGKTRGRVLVVDDSLCAGTTLRNVRAQLGAIDDLIFGAVYYASPMPELVDVVYRHVPHPRCFEWNLFHCDQMCVACLDMDGVICEDWTGHEDDEEPGLSEYLHHLNHARPKHLPTYPLLAIVTSRLEKYRPQTTAWLHRHGIKFHQLIMSPHPTATARRHAADHALRKADFYSRQPHAQLFIESDSAQASQIARLSGKTVLCTQSMALERRK